MFVCALYGFHLSIYELGAEPGTKVLRTPQSNEPLPGCKLPQEAAAIEELHDWSLNYNAGRNPYCVFLDLTGYSYDRWGCDAYIAPDITADSGRYSGILGYKELCLISDALKIFENYGYDQVYTWCDLLNDSED